MEYLQYQWKPVEVNILMEMKLQYWVSYVSDGFIKIDIISTAMPHISLSTMIKLCFCLLEWKIKTLFHGVLQQVNFHLIWLVMCIVHVLGCCFVYRLIIWMVFFYWWKANWKGNYVLNMDKTNLENKKFFVQTKKSQLARLNKVNVSTLTLSRNQTKRKKLSNFFPSFSNYLNSRHSTFHFDYKLRLGCFIHMSCTL